MDLFNTPHKRETFSVWMGKTERERGRGRNRKNYIKSRNVENSLGVNLGFLTRDASKRMAGSMFFGLVLEQPIQAAIRASI